VSSEPIVVGTDGSPTADRAVAKAGELAGALGATVHLVMSYSTVNTGGLAIAAGVPVDPGEANESARSHADAVLNRTGGRLEQMGVKVSQHVFAGDPSDALLAVAADVGAQMIVVGNKGMTGARRVLGSVPNRVSHHADCSVLIVHTR
jgi:nucleotide-binding universal stress UspA family protein